MITRRMFTSGLAAIGWALGWRPSGIAAEPVVHDGRVSANLARLADLWDAAACHYDVVRQAVCFTAPAPGRGAPYAPDAPEMRRYHEAARTMLAYADAVFREPSRKEADVLLKYDLMDQLMDGRHVPDRDAILAAGGGGWHRIIEVEAEAFGLKLNPFWLWETPRAPMIDGDPHAVVANRVLRRNSST